MQNSNYINALQSTIINTLNNDISGLNAVYSYLPDSRADPYLTIMLSSVNDKSTLSRSRYEISFLGNLVLEAADFYQVADFIANISTFLANLNISLPSLIVKNVSPNDIRIRQNGRLYNISFNIQILIEESV